MDPTPTSAPNQLSDAEQTRWFAEEVQPHEPVLRAWLRTSFPSVREADAEDIVQEAYVRFLRVRRERGSLEWPKAFLFTTARNLAIDLLRHQKIAKESPLVESGALNVLDEGQDIPEIVARKQEITFLTEAIQSLPERCRQVFTLRKVYDLSQKEIAAKLGISEHTVSAQLTIAIRKCTEYVIRRGTEKGRR